MQATATLLTVVSALLAVAVPAVALSRRPWAGTLVYGVSLAASLAGLGVALAALLAGAGSELTLPLGLPWIGARFGIDALSAFFLVVVNLGGAAGSPRRSMKGGASGVSASVAVASGVLMISRPDIANRHCRAWPAAG